MIISNTIDGGSKHIQGLFKYTDDIEYEKGDFVVYNNSIYICTAKEPTNSNNNTVCGIKPNEDNINYTIYLGDKIPTLKDYYKYAKDPDSGEDKYVSSYLLSEILQREFFGLSDTGIITESISFDNSYDNNVKTIIFSDRLSKLGLDNNSTSVLNEVLKCSYINNGLLRISSDLPEVEELCADGTNTDVTYYILRQYTYANESGTRVRIQELINPEKGDTYLRSAVGEITTSIDDATGEYLWNYTVANPWKISYDSSNSVADKLRAIELYYQKKVQNLNSELAILQNSYKNVSCWSGESNSITLDYTDIDFNGTDSKIMNVCLKSLINSNSSVVRNFSVITDILDAEEGSSVQYQVTDNLVLELSRGTGSVTLTTSDNDCYIKNVSYRLNYK